MTANSVEKNIFQQYVEKYYSVVLNVKLVKKKKWIQNVLSTSGTVIYYFFLEHHH